MLYRRSAPPLRFLSQSAAACLALLSLLAAGCADDGALTGPRPPSEGIQRSSAPDQSAFSWSEKLAGPSTNWGDGGGIPWTDVPLAGNRWYRVRVTGQTSLIDNPQWVDVCTSAGVDPCPAATYVGSYGPQGVPGSSDLRVVVRTSNGYEIKWDSADQELVFFLPAGATVRRMQTGLVSGAVCLTRAGCRGRTGSWNGEYGFYAYTSRPRLEIEGATIPVRVTADRAWAGSGDLVTYTAEADVPRVHDGAVTWFFVPGDTAATPIFPLNEPVPVNACAGRTVCQFAQGTYGPGRMYVDWHTRYGIARNASPVIGARPPALVLACTGDLGANRVTRGQQINCTATKEPASAPGELKITGWSFDGRARTDGDLTSTEWKGIMARRGKVEVRGTIGGAASRDEQTIRVERRGWSVMQFSVPRHVVGLDPASMADYPPAGLAYGRFLPVWPDFTILKVQAIDSGPNAGLWFLMDPVQLPQPLAFVHPALYFPALPAALGPGTPGHSQWLQWYNDQNGRPVGTCRPAAVTQFRRNVEIHEGATGATNSHWAVGNRVLSSTKLHERFEALTSDQGADDLRFRTNDAWQNWLVGPYRRAQSQFDTSDYPNVFNLGCSLDSNPNDS